MQKPHGFDIDAQFGYNGCAIHWERLSVGMFKKLITILIVLSLMSFGFASAEEAEHQPVVVLYTNDVHCGIDDYIGYAGLKAYERAYEDAGYQVAIADSGDAVQGGPVGTLSKGSYIIDIMNFIGYDVATIGNHEFDYGMDQFMALRDKADFPYVSANFCDMDGDTVLEPYAMLELGDWQVAFVGASTPETFAKSTPTYFQDEDGNYIYSFCQGNDGADFYQAVQEAVDSARADGADYVFVLSHLGILDASSPYTSSDLIVNTRGIDAVLDGHSHSVIEQEVVKNLDGDEVLLTSTGTKLEYVGALTIAADGSLSTQLHDEALFKDAEAAGYIAAITDQYEDSLNEVVATTDVELTINDPATGELAVRSAETNLGDLCADAYRYVLGADIGFINGGGIRAGIEAGDITYGDIINVHPFGNMMCVVEATGQQILDALEMGVRDLPDEGGSFQQVSGISFEIDMSVDSTVVVDDMGNFVEVSGERRIKNVLVDGQPIDPEGTYTLASHNYLIKNGGGGLNMFMNDVLLQDEVMIDNQVLINYIVDTLGGVVGEEYADPYGQGRIVFVQ